MRHGWPGIFCDDNEPRWPILLRAGFSGLACSDACTVGLAGSADKVFSWTTLTEFTASKPETGAGGEPCSGCTTELDFPCAKSVAAEPASSVRAMMVCFMVSA